MKKFFFYLLFTIFAICITLVSCNSSKKEDSKALTNEKIKKTISNLYTLIPPVAAIVNGTEIARDTVKISLNTQINSYLSMNSTSSSDNKKFIEKIVKTLIDEELIFQRAKSKNIIINVEEVNSEINSLKKRFKTEKEFQKYIKEQGFTLQTIKNELTKTQGIKKFIKSLSYETKITVNDDESLDYYTKNITMFKKGKSIKTAQILIKFDKDKPKEMKKAREKLEGLLKKAKSGEDFAALAKKYSEGPGARRGGNLGYLNKEAMIPSIENAALNAKINGISNIIETPFGFHIIKVLDKKEGRQLPFDEVRTNINTFLKQQKINNKIASLIEDLRKTATIEILL